MLVGDDQPHTVQPTLLGRGQEPAPERLILGVPDIDAEDLT